MCAMWYYEMWFSFKKEQEPHAQCPFWVRIKDKSVLISLRSAAVPQWDFGDDAAALV